MSSEEFTLDNFLEALRNDGKFSDKDNGVFEHLMPVFTEWISLVQSYLDDIADLRTVAEVRMLFIDLCREYNISQIVIEEIPPFIISIMGGRSIVLSILDAGLDLDLDLASLVSEDMMATITDLTEDDLMLNEEEGLIPDLHEAYKNGQLTIREVLTVQPSFII